MNEVPLPKSPGRTIVRIVYFVSLLTSVTSFLTFIFAVINYTFPNVSSSVYSEYSAIPYDRIQESFPVFLLSFLLFLASVYILRNKTLIQDGTVYSIGWKRFAYVIFILIGGTCIASLYTELMKWLGGEIFSRFAFKALAVVAVALFICTYYVREFYGIWMADIKKQNRFVALMSVLTLFVIGASFALVGTPSFHKSIQLDIGRRQDVESLKYQIECNCNDGILPSTEEVNTGDEKYSYYLTDIEKKPITYKKISNNEFQICAAFANDSAVVNEYIENGNSYSYSYTDSKWSYVKGGCQTFPFKGTSYSDSQIPLQTFTSTSTSTPSTKAKKQ